MTNDDNIEVKITRCLNPLPYDQNYKSLVAELNNIRCLLASMGTVKKFSFKDDDIFTGVVTNPTTTPELSLSISYASDISDGIITKDDYALLHTLQSLSLTTSGHSGAATYISGVLNIPNYTLSGLGGVPLTRNITINGITHDLSSDRTWTIPITNYISSISNTSTISLDVTTGNSTASFASLDISQFTNDSGYITDLSGFTTDDLIEGSTNLYDKTVALTAGTGISVTGTYPNFTITNTSPSTEGTVTSVSAGTGMSFSTITATGSVAIDTSKVPYLSGGFSTGLLKWNGSSWVFDSSSYLTTAITSLNGLTGATQTFVNDTNVTMVSSGTTHTITWSGTLADSRITSASTWNSKIGGSGTTNELAYFTASGTIGSLTTATYPSLTELSYIKGVTSSIQTQLNAKGSGTVTSVAALTLGTSGTDLSSTVVNGTTTPVITLNVPTASATNRGALSSTDWNTFNNKVSSQWTTSGSNIYYSTGCISVGTSTTPVGKAYFLGTTGTSEVFRIANQGANTGTTLALYNANATPSGSRNVLGFNQSRGDLSTPLALATDDLVGSIAGAGHDGTTYKSNISIDFTVDNTVSTSVVPIACVWKTTSTSSARAEVMRLSSAGNLLIGNTNGTDKLTVTGNLNLNTAGNKLKIATGSNASIGTSTSLVGGTITISTTAVTANSKIFLTRNTPGGTVGSYEAPTSSIVAGTSFVINSSSVLDTSTVNWLIIN